MATFPMIDLKTELDLTVRFDRIKTLSKYHKVFLCKAGNRFFFH